MPASQEGKGQPTSGAVDVLRAPQNYGHISVHNHSGNRKTNKQQNKAFYTGFALDHPC